MKKFIPMFVGVLVVIAIGLFSYLRPADNNLKNDIAGVISVENYVKADKAHMDSISQDYKWFETCVKMTGEVDTLEEPTIEMVTNIFQVNGDNPIVYGGKHLNGKTWWDTKEGFWCEDCDMMCYGDSIISFEDAFTKLKQSNVAQPRSAYCTLRKALGPRPSNPQWVFGNENRGIVFVDAITGKVSTFNPVFPNIALTSTPDSLMNFIYSK